MMEAGAGRVVGGVYCSSGGLFLSGTLLQAASKTSTEISAFLFMFLVSGQMYSQSMAPDLFCDFLHWNKIHMKLVGKEYTASVNTPDWVVLTQQELIFGRTEIKVEIYALAELNTLPAILPNPLFLLMHRWPVPAKMPESESLQSSFRKACFAFILIQVKCVRSLQFWSINALK